MNAGLLCTNEGLLHWFKSTYPNLCLYKQGNRQIFEHDSILLMESYLIMDNEYDLRPLWEKHMRVDPALRYKPLILVGYDKPKRSNYFSLYEPEENLLKVITQAKKLVEKPTYDLPNALDLRDQLASLLKTHFHSNVHHLITETWKQLKPLEKDLVSGKPLHMLNSETLQHARNTLSELERLWQDNQVFFTLMPQFPEMAELNGIILRGNQILYYGKVHPKRTFQELIDFLKYSIVPITRIHKLEKNERKYTGNR